MRASLSASTHEKGVVDTELGRVIKRWGDRLRAVEVETPDSALDIITNRWLPYQTLSCRFHARSAFYQSGGAFGFRDQLQDVLAFLHFEPALAREHILRAAGRQFPEGDTQHWWHEPGGEGVRTRIQDDRLWLVYAAMEYARVTGDWEIFDANAPLISQRAPGPEEHSVYETPTRLPIELSLFEHCSRAIARTMETGVHGLPLIGTGDWNDGMDEVGARRPRRERLARMVPRIAARHRLPRCLRPAERLSRPRHTARTRQDCSMPSKTPGTANGIAARTSTMGRRWDRMEIRSAESTRSLRAGRSSRVSGSQIAQ